jgi:hypothetical protein
MSTATAPFCCGDRAAPTGTTRVRRKKGGINARDMLLVLFAAEPSLS